MTKRLKHLPCEPRSKRFVSVQQSGQHWGPGCSQEGAASTPDRLELGAWGGFGVHPSSAGRPLRAAQGGPQGAVEL